MGMEALVKNHVSANHSTYSARAIDRRRNEERGSRGAASSGKCSSSGRILSVKRFELSMLSGNYRLGVGQVEGKKLGLFWEVL